MPRTIIVLILRPSNHLRTRAFIRKCNRKDLNHIDSIQHNVDVGHDFDLHLAAALYLGAND